MNLNQGCGRKIEPHVSLSPSDPEYYPCCTIVNDEWQQHLWRFLPKTFDLIIADPPYGKKDIGFQDHHAKRQDWDDRFPSEDLLDMLKLSRLGTYYFCCWDNLWDYEGRASAILPGTPEENGIPILDQRWSSDYPTVSVESDHVVLNNLPKPKSVFIWHKVGSGGGGAGDCEHAHGRAYEMILFYPGPDHKFKTRASDVLAYERPGNHAHPTEKPVDLLKEIMGWYDFETVLDPFMGSGSTAVAAKELGKHFLGFEANETFYKRAIQRIAKTPSPVPAQ